MSGGGRKAAGPSGEEAEVEALLRAAQDAVLLKLQANSHLVSSASASAPSVPLDGAAAALPDPLEDDLARRFDALKSRAAAPKPKPAGAGAAAPAAASGMDELEARFAALKGAAGPEKEARVRLEDLGGESSEDEEDEVDKVMRWAMDAARLDVATAGAGDKAKRAEAEEEKDDKSSVSSEDDDDERLQLEMARKRKEMAKSKTKSKWFFL
ncbi:hypothetical protein GQ55_6G032600 [Panicum hallii var. hallii]|uniref:Uncharacterized protein n=1 Tax=Panicum hallii var. hallii TaxID=1504633 RepID=A0A2T7D3B9_9POAL|nr:hypothetical protein GQ55_6G032600 [Panicum hallii var. hallii]